MTTMFTEREITRQVGGLVATELGYTVDTNPDLADHRGVYLDGPAGERLFLSLDWKDNDRLVVSGVYPPHDAYGIARHEIGVKRDRGPAVIAREITRRLLPGYAESLTAVREANAARDTARVARTAAAAEVRNVLPGATSHDSGNRITVRTSMQGDVGYGDFQTNSDGSGFTIELRSVPFAVALKVAEVLAAAAAK